MGAIYFCLPNLGPHSPPLPNVSGVGAGPISVPLGGVWVRCGKNNGGVCVATSRSMRRYVRADPPLGPYFVMYYGVVGYDVDVDLLRI